MRTSLYTDECRPDRRVAFFAGSFDPFTKGHEDIVLRALPLFDEVIIAIGVNPDKVGFLTIDQRHRWIDACIGWRNGVRVVTFTGLAAQAAIDQGACCFVKGVRTMQDFEYEMQMAQANHDLSGLDTVLFYTAPQLAHISSSLVRQLHTLGQDVRPYLPDMAPIGMLP
ncbi:MAG: pantetheine-phosphate adenylyltransferase [Muribaculaceae bacterium]|nr:pantetheine-phosphate adenylyltransferase [Muribaculaceae bacterium]